MVLFKVQMLLIMVMHILFRFQINILHELNYLVTLILK